MDQWLNRWGISNSSGSSTRAPRSNWLFKWSSPFFIFFLTTLHFWPRLFHNWNFKSQSLFPLIKIGGSLMCTLLLPFHLSKSWSKNTVYPGSTQAIVGTHYLMVRWTFMGGFLLTEDWKYMMGDKWSGAFIGSKVTSEKEEEKSDKAIKTDLRMLYSPDRVIVMSYHIYWYFLPIFFLSNPSCKKCLIFVLHTNCCPALKAGQQFLWHFSQSQRVVHYFESIIRGAPSK